MSSNQQSPCLSVETDITYEKTSPFSPLSSPLSSPLPKSYENNDNNNNHVELIELISNLSPENKKFLMHKIKSDNKLFDDEKAKVKKAHKKRGFTATIVDIEEVEQKGAQHIFPSKLHLVYTEVKRHGRIYNVKLQFRLNILQRLFLVLNEPQSSLVSALYSAFIIIFTVLSVIIFIITTDRLYKVAPSTCDLPACSNDPDLCPNSVICEPQEMHSLAEVEYACLIAFLIDYFGRIALLPFMHPRLCGVIEDNLDLIDNLEEDQIFREQYTMLESGTPIDMQYKNINWMKKIVYYVLKPMNLIDFIAILPWFLSFASISPGSVTIVRVLRLGRILRILRIGKDSEWLIIMALSIYRSLPALGSLLFFSAFSNVIFGCIIFFFEAGTFEVDATDYPDGYYIREDLLGDPERSPFESIPLAIYYSIVSSTTVGYGDLYATTEGGRFFSICCMYCGVMTLALPIAVIGNNFSSLYDFFRGKVGIKLAKIFLINWIHSPHDTRKLMKQKVHDKFSKAKDDDFLTNPMIEDTILVHELVSKLSSLYVIGLSCIGPYFEKLEDELIFMNLLEGFIYYTLFIILSFLLLFSLSLGLELMTSNFSNCTQEEIFKTFSDYLDKNIGYNKFSESTKTNFSNFGSDDELDHKSKKDKKRLFEELTSINNSIYSRDKDVIETGRAKNAIHRTIAKLFVDALEREVSDTVAKVDEYSASIIQDNNKLIMDVYNYPFIEHEKSIHSTNNKLSFNEYWNSCFTEMFYFCKGKRNLIF